MARARQVIVGLVGHCGADASYLRIAVTGAWPGARVVALHDSAELNAARDASFQTALCIRPGNSDPGNHSHREIRTLMQIDPARNG